MLQKYSRAFSKLNTGYSRGIRAPHKPVLLLSVLQSIRSGAIFENKITITPELVAKFRENWSALVHTHFTPNFALPFFHLKGDKFWHLNTYPGRELVLTSSGSIKSFQSLRETVNYASFDDELFMILLHPESNILLEKVLLNTYFPQASTTPVYTLSLFDKIEDKILREPPGEYKAEIERIDEEEVFVRRGVFKKVIPRIYNQTCCISGLRIVAGDIQMIDACHIVPFSESRDDTITNGISLSPNFHRAFDRYLLTIDENYRVVLSKNFTEKPDYLKCFEGKVIQLPVEKRYYPSQENLQLHRQRFSKINN